MYVGIAKLDIAIAQAHSLKEKRMVLRRIKDRVRERLGLAINEVGSQDVWQRAELGVAVTSSERRIALELLDAVVSVVAGIEHGALIGVAKDVQTFEAEVAPVVIDDRTGSGDKAAAHNLDWVPDQWKEKS